ncbi:MAG: IS200/IS605 family transposase, partial [Anaerolineales bacterium]
PAARFRALVDTDQGEPLTASPEETLQSQEVTRKVKTRKPEPAPETIRETTAPAETEVARKIVLEPVTPAVYNLDYACLLLPRFPQHHMTGELLDRLGEWVPHICIAFAWRLEYISVRPEHLQWIVNVPPATSPAYLMRILRQHTSERIFSEFPYFKKENPSGDFWAPGYLIMGGSQPPPAQLIKDFINQTRQRQGIIQFNNR